MASLLIKNIGMLATACGDRAKSGKAQGEILTLQNAYVLVQDEQILEIGQGEPTIDPACEVIDAQGKLVTAGLVDAHTHLVFGGWRENELALKLHGVSGHPGAGWRHTVHRAQHTRCQRGRAV